MCQQPNLIVVLFQSDPVIPMAFRAVAADKEELEAYQIRVVQMTYCPEPESWNDPNRYWNEKLADEVHCLTFAMLE